MVKSWRNMEWSEYEEWLGEKYDENPIEIHICDECGKRAPCKSLADPYEVTRDHKVVLDADGNVIGTEPSPNPVQPKPSPPVVPDVVDLRSPNGTVWTISVDNMGKLQAKKRR